jgi:hypothetical protein
MEPRASSNAFVHGYSQNNLRNDAPFPLFLVHG